MTLQKFWHVRFIIVPHHAVLRVTNPASQRRSFLVSAVGRLAPRDDGAEEVAWALAPI